MELSRRRMSPEQRRAQLIEAGAELFSQHSYATLSATSAARHAGISKALLFHHFGNLRGFYLAVLEEIAERVEDITRPVPGLPLPMQLEVAVRRFVEFIRDFPALFRLLYGNIGADPDVRNITERVRRIEVERVLEQSGIAEPSAQIRTAVYGWVGFAEAATLEWIDHRSYDEDALVKMILAAAQVFLSAVPPARR